MAMSVEAYLFYIAYKCKEEVCRVCILEMQRIRSLFELIVAPPPAINKHTRLFEQFYYLQ